jgi:hypothetical protein
MFIAKNGVFTSLEFREGWVMHSIVLITYAQFSRSASRLSLYCDGRSECDASPLLQALNTVSDLHSFVMPLAESGVLYYSEQNLIIAFAEEWKDIEQELIV